MRAFLRAAAVVLAAAFFLLTILMQAHTPVEEDWHWSASRVDDLQDLSARIDREALEIHRGQVRQYDGLALLIQASRTALADLRARHGQNPAILAAIAQASERFEEKAALVDDFERESAVARNSLMFLPRAADLVAAEGELPEGTRLAARAIFQDLLLYNLYGDPETARRIEARLPTLAGAPPGSAVELLARHTQALLTRGPRVEAALTAMQDPGAEEAYVGITEALSAERRVEERRAETWRWILAITSTAIVGTIVHFVWQLRASRERLSRANESLAARQGELTAERVRVTQLNLELEARVAARTAQLEAAHVRLVGLARQAGKAEVAADVMHNVGNALNGVGVAADVVLRRLERSCTGRLERALSLLDANASDLSGFLARDPVGMRLPAYLSAVATRARQDERDIITEVRTIQRQVENLQQIVAEQQAHTGASSTLEESVDVPALVEEAMDEEFPMATRAGVEVIRRYDPLPPVWLDRARLLHVLRALLSNARQALAAGGEARLELGIRAPAPGAEPTVRIEVSDAGEGIAPDDMRSLFQQGFTSRAGGRGLGLHNAALAVRTMGGRLLAHSDGRGKGASLTVELPAVFPGLSDEERGTLPAGGAACSR